jgi:HEAT repeat protein
VKLRLQSADGLFFAIHRWQLQNFASQYQTDRDGKDWNVETGMNATASRARTNLFNGKQIWLLLLALASVVSAAARAQSGAAKPASTAAQEQSAAANNPAAAGNEEEVPAVTLSPTATRQQRTEQAWKILTDAATDMKHTQTRLQALTALGLLRSPRSAKLVADAMADPGLDVRAAAALAAGLNRDRTLEPNLLSLLDDKEPQVAFTAAMTLSKMGDRSGDDILVAVVDGERSAGPTMMHGAEHKIDNDLHNPEMLAWMGAMQGAEMFMGPFGYGIAAFEFMHQSGGDLARVSAIEQISKEMTEPVHKKLLAALGDKDAAVRAAAAEALADYHDNATSAAIYPLFADKKVPVRLIAAAAYLRTTGVPGPLPVVAARAVRAGR